MNNFSICWRILNARTHTYIYIYTHFLLIYSLSQRPRFGDTLLFISFVCSNGIYLCFKKNDFLFLTL